MLAQTVSCGGSGWRLPACPAAARSDGQTGAAFAQHMRWHCCASLALRQHPCEGAYQMTSIAMSALKTVCVLYALTVDTPRFACCAGEPPKKPAPPGIAIPELRNLARLDPVLGADVVRWQEEIRAWSVTSVCEKLALAEWLLEVMTDTHECRSGSYEWSPGSDDLSLSGGRAKWALELVLRLKLPGIVDRDTSLAQRRAVREQARLAVKAYRQGAMASAADHEIPPERFAHLKRRYKGRIPGGPWPDESGVAPGSLGMDEILFEWPPIGRRYEDLVSLIGAKGEHERTENEVSYTFEGFGVSFKYIFTVQQGMIRSVRKSTF